MIEIVAPGIATTVQDVGRVGLAHLGVPSSGAVDPALAGLVNRLVGNAPVAPLLETVGDLEVVALRHVTIASTADLSPTTLAPGERHRVPTGAQGRVWQYLALRGGLDVAPVLGSCACDTLSGLGPPPPSTGDTIHAGDRVAGAITADQAPLADLGHTARIAPGPRRDWFTDGSWAALVSTPCAVTTSSRIGVRLRGPVVERTVSDELPSEGLVRGAIQAPPGGELVMMLADHPTTGGYPVIAVVHPDDVATVAQHSTATAFRFRVYG